MRLEASLPIHAINDFSVDKNKKRQSSHNGSTGALLFLALGSNINLAVVRIDLDQGLTLRATHLCVATQIHQPSITLRTPNLFQNQHYIITPQLLLVPSDSDNYSASCWEPRIACKRFRCALGTPYTFSNPLQLPILLSQHPYLYRPGVWQHPPHLFRTGRSASTRD